MFRRSWFEDETEEKKHKEMKTFKQPKTRKNTMKAIVSQGGN